MIVRGFLTFFEYRQIFDFQCPVFWKKWCDNSIITIRTQKKVRQWCYTLFDQQCCCQAKHVIGQNHEFRVLSIVKSGIQGAHFYPFYRDQHVHNNMSTLVFLKFCLQKQTKKPDYQSSSWYHCGDWVDGHRSII